MHTPWHSKKCAGCACYFFCYFFCHFPACRRAELDAAVPWPSSHVLAYKALPAAGVIADSLAWLNWAKESLLKPAKR